MIKQSKKPMKSATKPRCSQWSRSTKREKAVFALTGSYRVLFRSQVHDSFPDPVYQPWEDPLPPRMPSPLSKNGGLSWEKGHLEAWGRGPNGLPRLPWASHGSVAGTSGFVLHMLYPAVVETVSHRAPTLQVYGSSLYPDPSESSESR